MFRGRNVTGSSYFLSRGKSEIRFIPCSRSSNMESTRLRKAWSSSILSAGVSLLDYGTFVIIRQRLQAGGLSRSVDAGFGKHFFSLTSSSSYATLFKMSFSSTFLAFDFILGREIFFDALFSAMVVLPFTEVLALATAGHRTWA
ncbi:unnamed protein product [Dicrocoelium dendriticum]|nr:unnamed protein product [Dicrocoelium dendriticum]